MPDFQMMHEMDAYVAPAQGVAGAEGKTNMFRELKKQFSIMEHDLRKHGVKQTTCMNEERGFDQMVSTLF